MQEHALYALDVVPEVKFMVRCLVHMGLANVHERLEDTVAAYEQYDLAVPLLCAAGNYVAAANAVMHQSLVNMLVVRWSETDAQIDFLLDHAGRSGAGASLVLGMAYIARGPGRLYAWRLEEALDHLEKGLALAEPGGGLGPDSAG